MAERRRKKFKPDPSVSFQLQERDVDIIHDVYTHRFLDTSLITLKTGASRQAVQRRLNKLYHNGYLSRPGTQRTRQGNNSMVYALGNEGARLLARRYDYDIERQNWACKNRESKNDYLDHSLMTARFLILAEVFCKTYANKIDFIPAREMISKRPVPAKERFNPLSWRVEGKAFPEYKGSVVPDGAFGLKYALKDGRKMEKYFFIEADRSTMPVKRNNLNRSSYFKKLIAYWESFDQGLFEKYWGFKSARVLTLTLSVERSRNIQAACRELDRKGRGLGLFLFAPEAVFRHEDVKTFIGRNWISGAGKQVSVVE